MHTTVFKRVFSIGTHLSCFGFILSMFLGCAQQSNVETALDEQILHFGLGSEPQHLDPHLATSVAAHNILSALLEGLVSEDPKTLKPLPGVAKSWEILEEGKKYVFHIRKNARWSNGDKITADDFVYSFRRILNPNLGAQYASMLYPCLLYTSDAADE